VSSVPGREQPKQEPSRPERLAERLGYTTTTVESPRWAAIVRQVAIFLLGVWLIIYSVVATSKNLVYIITGLVLIGIIPVEHLLNAAAKTFSRQEKK
jgi:hypothetical protein